MHACTVHNLYCCKVDRRSKTKKKSCNLITRKITFNCSKVDGCLIGITNAIAFTSFTVRQQKHYILLESLVRGINEYYFSFYQCYNLVTVLSTKSRSRLFSPRKRECSLIQHDVFDYSVGYTWTPSSVYFNKISFFNMSQTTDLNCWFMYVLEIKFKRIDFENYLIPWRTFA